MELNLPLNNDAPQIMHIDLNSCFATIEQQARPLLRGRPVAVTNRLTPYCCIITASYEAKRQGVTVGMRFDHAKRLVPDLIMVETDPPKYHYVYRKLTNIMKCYSPNVKMKSIDEGLIDFTDTREHINNRSLEDIGHEIKQRLRDEVGCWMKCNIGIGPNRFLAKTAASLHKPDGLDVITHKNLREVYKTLELTDLTGIAEHFEARLNAVGIMNPIDFLDAPSSVLRRLVFKSICGDDWYKRLRGYEVDNVNWQTKTVGRQYVLEKRDLPFNAILKRLHYLCETTGMKLRYKGKEARGVYVYARMTDSSKWYARRMHGSSFFLNEDVYQRAVKLFSQIPQDQKTAIREIGISCYGLSDSNRSQLSIFDELMNKERWMGEAVDRINGRYGEFTMHSADTLDVKGIVKQKIPFGGTSYFELLCRRA